MIESSCAKPKKNLIDSRIVTIIAIVTIPPYRPPLNLSSIDKVLKEVQAMSSLYI
jgi:hypothetical protein